MRFFYVINKRRETRHCEWWISKALRLSVSHQNDGHNPEFITLMNKVVNSWLWSSFWRLTDHCIVSIFLEIRHLRETYSYKKTLKNVIITCVKVLKMHQMQMLCTLKSYCFDVSYDRWCVWCSIFVAFFPIYSPLMDRINETNTVYSICWLLFSAMLEFK